MAQKHITTTMDFEDVPARFRDYRRESTVENISRLKTVFEVETTQRLFKAHSLDEAMKLWKESGDQSEVLRVTRVG